MNKQELMDVAKRYLNRKGYAILSQDWRAADGEVIGIVAESEGVIVFVQAGDDDGMELVDERRETAARQWLAAHGAHPADVRFDNIEAHATALGALVRHRINAIAESARNIAPLHAVA